MKPIFLTISLVLFTVFFGKQLLPGNTMFDFHDVSQPARVAEFSFDLTHLQIPPRFAPHMSYGMGYPVFNFYAPFSYWVTSFIHLIGFDVADSLKLSFCLALLVSFISMFYFLRSFFKEGPSLFGAFLYVASPYLAMEIFARGNLGELWFVALLPAALLLLRKNSYTSSPYMFIVTALVTSFTLTVHNVLSLVFLPLVIIYIILLKTAVRKNFFTLFISLLLSSYFLIPAILESNFTNATQIAEFTNYKDHFLCWWQIWTTNVWGYGASNPGCMSDGISFMVGKAQIIFGALGVILLSAALFKKRKMENKEIFVFVALILVGSAFMSTYSSGFIWNSFHQLAVFQFPWRFLIFTLFGLAFFSAYFVAEVKISAIKILAPLAVVVIIVLQSKYFYKAPLSKTEFNKRYVAEKVITETIAYRVAEYLPRNGDYDFWRSIEGNIDKQSELLMQTKDFIYPLDGSSATVIHSNEFDKKALTSSQNFLLNVHYLPFWHIKINNKEIIPERFDVLARPIIHINNVLGGTVELYYQQTPIETSANYLTIAGFLLLLLSPYFFKQILKIDHNHDRS